VRNHCPEENHDENDVGQLTVACVVFGFLLVVFFGVEEGQHRNQPVDEEPNDVEEPIEEMKGRAVVVEAAHRVVSEVVVWEDVPSVVLVDALQAVVHGQVR
jgi:hypothetical protein